MLLKTLCYGVYNKSKTLSSQIMEKIKIHKWLKYVWESDVLKKDNEIGNDNYGWEGWQQSRITYLSIRIISVSVMVGGWMRIILK